MEPRAKKFRALEDMKIEQKALTLMDILSSSDTATPKPPVPPSLTSPLPVVSGERWAAEDEDDDT
jgi:hypothetical protein